MPMTLRIPSQAKQCWNFNIINAPLDCHQPWIPLWTSAPIPRWSILFQKDLVAYGKKTRKRDPFTFTDVQLALALGPLGTDHHWGSRACEHPSENRSHALLLRREEIISRPSSIARPDRGH
jgi:hypothetical protein